MSTNWNPILTQVFAWLGIFGLTGGIAATAALGLFKFLGTRWVDSKLQERLVTFKAEKDHELEKLRAEIGRMLDRAAKFNTKEYEVLPEAWKLLTMAVGLTTYLVSSLRSRPDLDRMSEPELSEFLNGSDLKDWQKSELRQTRDKSKYYSTHCSWRELTQAENALADYNNYVALNDIFIEDNFLDTMNQIRKELSAALVYIRSHFDGTGVAGSWIKAKEHQTAAESLVETLRANVRSRISDFKSTGYRLTDS